MIFPLNKLPIPSFRAVVLSMKNNLYNFYIVDYLFFIRTLVSVFFICNIKRVIIKSTYVVSIKYKYFKYSHSGYSKSLYNFKNFVAKYVNHMLKNKSLISTERRSYQKTYLYIYIYRLLFPLILIVNS